MKQEKKGLKWGDVLFVIYVVMVCGFVILTIQGKMPSFFGYRFLHVVSGSMEPEIKNGSYIIIKETETDELKEGDIITFISADPVIYGKYNTHRIYDICKDTYTGETIFITKGDAYDSPDSYPVTTEAVVGKVVKVFSFGGK